MLGACGCNAKDEQLTTSDDHQYDTYIVIFKVDNVLYDTVSVKYGETAVLSKDNPTKEGWVFIGWDKSLNNITVDTTVNAVWERDEDDNVESDKIKIIVKNATKANFTAWSDGSVGDKVFYINYGETFTVPTIVYDTYDEATKNNDEYIFVGWYYNDKNGTKCEFDQSRLLSLENLNIDSNELTIYAKVRSRWIG